MALKVDKNLYYILFAFLAVHIFLYLTVGIISSLESEKYIKQADYLLSGRFPGASKYYFYLPIIFLIALAKSLSLGYGFVVIVQSFISAIALAFFYHGTKIIFDKRVALFSALALCLFIPFHSWNFYLYSDSIFISLSLLLYYAVCRFENHNPQWLLPLLFLVVAMVFSRPFGVLFIPPLFLYFLLIKYRNRTLKFVTLAASFAFIIIMYFVIQAIFHGGEDMDAMKPFIEEHIVCFVANKPEGAPLDLKYYDNGIRDIFYYIIHNPMHFLKLMSQRLFSFFKFSRSWYSSFHNLFLTAFIIPVYTLFFIGVFQFTRAGKNAIIYFIALIVLYPLAATFQCDDWHSRFTMPVLPPIFALAAYGFFCLLKKKKKVI